MSRILVIEDDDDVQFSLLMLLGQEGHCALAASSAETALEILSLEQFDLVIVDLLLPGMDGAELCRVIRQDDVISELPIVIVSAMPHLLGIEFTENDANWVPANRFIDKCDTGDKLMNTVCELLKSSLVNT
jgi:CheY-like chemotaxis protein